MKRKKKWKEQQLAMLGLGALKNENRNNTRRISTRDH